jgi:hypothetical protein
MKAENPEKPDADPQADALAAARKLRKLLILPGHAFVGRWNGQVYLTDQFVCLKVTGNVAVRELEDGPYKITVKDGFVPHGVGTFNAEVFIHALEDGAVWLPVRATRWSIAEDKAKGLLVFMEDPEQRWPLGVNEDLWFTFNEEYQGSMWDAKGSRTDHGLFRVRWGTNIIAYVAGTRIPEEEKKRAQLVVDTEAKICPTSSLAA